MANIYATRTRERSVLTVAEIPDGIQLAVAGQRFILSGDDAYHLANRLVDTLEGE